MGNPVKTFPGGLCPHGMNPISCLTCWRASGAKVKTSGPPVAGVIPNPGPGGGKAPPPEAYSEEKLWEPAAHPSVSDRAPRRGP
jgi:hypothetical protein